MGQLETETVQRIALDLIRDIETLVWESAETEKETIFLKIAAYNAGIIDMTDRIINAIEELKK